VAHGAEYVERDLEELPDSVKPCQFPCCFQGYASVSDLTKRVHDKSPARRSPSGIQVGQEVSFRQVDQQRVTTVRIVHGAGDPAKGELSRETPIAKALLGCEQGEVVEVALPQRVMQVEITEVA
jgi:transcription elongation GreA/GreB family factor